MFTECTSYVKKNETSNFDYNRETAFTLMKAGETWLRTTDDPYNNPYSQIQLQQMEISALRRLRQEEGELEAILNYMTPCLQKQTKTTY